MDDSKETDPPPPPDSPGRSSTERNEASTPRILVVDDSALIRRVVEQVLSGLGYRVETASSGEEAFATCLAHPFDLVVSDITMGALSGVQLCRLLRSDPNFADVPVVLLTAADDPRSRFWARNAGADTYIAKESMREVLPGEVERLLKTRADRPKPVQTVTGRSIDPIQRLSDVLEQHLFRAVVSSEMRRLMQHLEDRQSFGAGVLSLAAEVSEYAYLVLSLDGPDGPTWAIHARGPWPAEMTESARSALGLLDARPDRIELVAEGPTLPEGKYPETGEMMLFPIEARGNRFGELMVFGGNRRLGPTDAATIELIASELGIVVQSLFLMEQTKLLALTDGLTGLANRRKVTERLQHELLRAQRSARPLCVALCDVDHFKSVNDKYGHNVGDEVLREVATVLRQAVRQVDLVGRWGGEEFIVLLPDASVMGGRIVAERLRACVANSTPPADGPPQVTISIGVAAYAPGMNSVTIVEAADEALYRAKRRGRNRVEIAGEGGSDKT